MVVRAGIQSITRSITWDLCPRGRTVNSRRQALEGRLSARAGGVLGLEGGGGGRLGGTMEKGTSRLPREALRAPGSRFRLGRVSRGPRLRVSGGPPGWPGGPGPELGASGRTRAQPSARRARSTFRPRRAGLTSRGPRCSGRGGAAAGPLRGRCRPLGLEFPGPVGSPSASSAALGASYPFPAPPVLGQNAGSGRLSGARYAPSSPGAPRALAAAPANLQCERPRSPFVVGQGFF